MDRSTMLAGIEMCRTMLGEYAKGQQDEATLEVASATRRRMLAMLWRLIAELTEEHDRLRVLHPDVDLPQVAPIAGRRAVTFTVRGEAKPAGSKRPFVMRDRRGQIVMRDNGTPVILVTDDCAKGKAWRRMLRRQVGAQLPRGFAPLEGPVRVSFEFRISRPKGHYGTGRRAGIVKQSAPSHHVQVPDVLKLARAAEDALTGILWHDDKQIVSEALEKSWGREDVLVITVQPCGEQQSFEWDSASEADMPF